MKTDKILLNCKYLNVLSNKGDIQIHKDGKVGIVIENEKMKQQHILYSLLIIRKVCH